MAFLSGEEPIGLGETEVDITFTPAFGAAPDIVLAVVQNTVDNPQLSIKAQVTAKDENGMTVNLDGTTDSANYVLAWIAGDAELVFQAVTKLGTRITDLPGPTRELRASDRLIVVMDGVTRQVPFNTFESTFVKKVSTPPTTATETGNLGDFAFDTNNAYVHTGARWLRIPYGGHATDWTIAATNSTKVTQAGTHAFADEDTEAVVVFDESFPSGGSAPIINYSIINKVDGSPTVISGVISAVSLTGFTLDVSPDIDSDNYILNWVATQHV